MADFKNFSSAYRPKNNREPFKPKHEGPNKNQFIRAKEVMLIDENGQNVGIVPTSEALERAQAVELDLVEVSPQANPPVCKIIDFSKYLYEQKKKKRQGSKTGKVKPMKEFLFSPVIAGGDVEVRVKRAHEYLSKGHNVRVTMLRKGRITQEQAQSKFNEILTNFEGFDTIEDRPMSEGRKLFVTFKSDGKAKNKQNSSKEIQVEQSKGQQEE